ncbi:unnamed protein product [Rhizoctonia solani]|uniref:Jacalin-type lectin domain-containing protein n=1 Tax=Rhizoctonia solani TaxID=456999 RepID=A0A8H3AIE5_9AGAM|nr:unnamed protein product [Rhizoctonia solani]
MAEVNDTELAAYVEMHKCCVEDNEDTILANAEDLLYSSKLTPHVHNVSPADDSRKIAKDAFGVLQAFEDISGELGVTNDATVKQQWDANAKNYRGMLEDTVKLAQQGSKYIQNLNDTVLSNISEDGADWEKNRDLIASFIKNSEGEKFMKQTAEASQKFTDLKYDTQAFHNTYADNATKKGQAYNVKLKELDDNRRSIQSQIDRYNSRYLHAYSTTDFCVVRYSNRASSAQLRGSMQRTAGPGFLLGWLVRAVLSLLGINTFNRGNSRIAELESQEQELVKKRTAVDSQADGLAKQESALMQTRHAVSVLADNVSDISGRLNTLAQTWSEIHFNIVRLGEMLNDAASDGDQYTFMRRMRLIQDSTSSLTANLQAYINGIAPGGVIPQPVKKKPPTYDISRMYGNSDGGGGVQAFNDAQPDLDPAMSISEIKIVSGWVVDGFHVTYRLKNGGTRTVIHGSNRAGAQVFLKRTEYISAVWGRSGRADNGEPWYGDCVQQLTFEITDSATGARRNTGTYGQAFKLSPAATTNISWRGRLLCVAGTANNGSAQVGFRGIKFVQLKP